MKTNSTNAISANMLISINDCSNDLKEHMHRHSAVEISLTSGGSVYTSLCQKKIMTKTKTKIIFLAQSSIYFSTSSAMSGMG